MQKWLGIFMSLYLVLTGQYEENNSNLTLTFTGDIMAHNVNYLMEDYSLIYREIEYLFLNDNLTFSNLEFPVNPSFPQSSYPSFNVHPPYVQAAIDAGIDVFSLANNHTYDKGKYGCLETFISMAILKSKTERPIYFSGIKYRAEKDYSPVSIDMKGWNIGFIALTQFSNAPYHYEHLFKVDYRNPDEVERFFEWIDAFVMKYDLLIVSYHGGDEYRLAPDPQKREFFYKLINKGVHIIYAHHPHVLQPYEIITKNGLNSLILYSTGNLISGQNYGIEFNLPQDYFSYTSDSAIFTVKVKMTQDGPTILDVSPFLIGNIITERNDVVIKPLKDLSELPPDNPYSDYYKKRYAITSELILKNRIISQWE